MSTYYDNIASVGGGEGLLLENCPGIFFLFDERQCFAACSREGFSFLGGEDSDEFKGVSLRQVFGDSGADWIEKAYNHNFDVFTNGVPATFEDNILLRDGRELQARISVTPAIDKLGIRQGTVMAINDISELARMKQASDKAALSKSSFLANMSHEIRTPINAIKGLTELLALTPLTSVQSNYVLNIISSTNSLLSLINDVLDFSRIDSDTIDFIEGDYSLAGLISEVNNLISLRAADKGLTLIMDISPELPAMLKGDEVRLKQVMVNILSNAVKYTHEGRVIFRLYGEKKSETDMELVCEVEDTGIGIREEELANLFRPFTRLDIQANRNVLGTGLGLSISHRLTEGMGGKISVQSTYGKGSIFTIRLPQGIASEIPLARVENPEQKNVLLLKDAFRWEYIAEMMDRLGVKYTTASGEEDVYALEADSFTHCIYDDSFDRDMIRHIRAGMPDCLFAVVKEMRYAMDKAEEYDAVLFVPLLITELVKILAREPKYQDEEATGKSIDDFALDNVHALIVDDNEVNLLVSGEILRSYKADVTCAYGGREALELCAETVYDIIFMDHMMPDMDGMETTIELRHRDGPNRNTPIIALTANVAHDVPDCYMAIGMNDYIGKPIEISELSRVLRNWLPDTKIVSMKKALQPEGRDGNYGEDAKKRAMERLIVSMDAFGMYVSDVMREIHNDYCVYLRRMERIRHDLNPLVVKLREEVAAQRWDEFAADVGELASMIHDVGARDCSGRARKLCQAAQEYNANYIRGDFFSLMDNMYMLQKKMEVAVPLAKGEIGEDVPFGDREYCRDLLRDMRDALSNQDMESAEGLIESLSCYSLDHDLDMILNDIRARLAVQDFTGALPLHTKALEHCENSLRL